MIKTRYAVAGAVKYTKSAYFLEVTFKNDATVVYTLTDVHVPTYHSLKKIPNQFEWFAIYTSNHLITDTTAIGWLTS